MTNRLQREVRKEGMEHPWASRGTIRRIARDHVSKERAQRRSGLGSSFLETPINIFGRGRGIIPLAPDERRVHLAQAFSPVELQSLGKGLDKDLKKIERGLSKKFMHPVDVVGLEGYFVRYR